MGGLGGILDGVVAEMAGTIGHGSMAVVAVVAMVVVVVVVVMGGLVRGGWVGLRWQC